MVSRNEWEKTLGIEVDCDLDKEQRNGMIQKAGLSYYQCSLVRIRV